MRGQLLTNWTLNSSSNALTDITAFTRMAARTPEQSFDYWGSGSFKGFSEGSRSAEGRTMVVDNGGGGLGKSCETRNG